MTIRSTFVGQVLLFESFSNTFVTLSLWETDSVLLFLLIFDQEIWLTYVGYLILLVIWENLGLFLMLKNDGLRA